ncbi:MAG: DUF6186 family protein [Acidimicrobiia bacterium]
MTFSRSLTITGWIVIAVAIASAWIGALVSRGRFPTGVALLRTATRRVLGRIIALAGWAWIGWHFFVRTTR